MSKMIQITLEGKPFECQAGMTYGELAEQVRENYPATIALAVVNNRTKELHHKVKAGAEVSFDTFLTKEGHKAYMRSVIMLLLKASYDVVGAEHIEKIKVEFSVGKAYYVTFKGDMTLDQTLADKIKTRMTELVEADLPIKKLYCNMDDAMEKFREYGMRDKERLFHYRRSSTVNLYSLSKFEDYYFGCMVPSTGFLKHFDLIPYDEDGMMLVLPKRKAAEESVSSEYTPSPKLFAEMKNATKWNEMLEIGTIGDLNDCIAKGDFADLVLVQEALQEKRIGEIAEDIVKKGGRKFIMIAGPSSSGKTSFSHRLSIQLRAHGLKPHPIALDNYYRDREFCPRDEKGDYDFECLEALDVELFNQNMQDLLAGKKVELPVFNFLTGKPEYKGNFMQLGEDDVLVIEGIHGLNEKMSHSLPEDCKYKIYISALTTLNVDEHNVIPTTDGRLIRRMVRDFRTRGASAQKTLSMWRSVRNGEDKYIFPFQEGADAMFNSALIYELAVLKQYAEPILFEIGQDAPEYREAQRLLKFLEYVQGVTTEDLPHNSIVREFVGGSVFPV